MNCTATLRKPPIRLINLISRQYKPIPDTQITRNVTTWPSRRRRLPTHRRSISSEQSTLEMKRMTESFKPPPKEPPKKYNPFILISAFVAVLLYKEYHECTSSPDPSKFVEFTLVGKEAVSSTSSIFTLRPKEAFPRNWGKGAFSVEFKQPELMIGREYTPLPPIIKYDTSIEGGEDTKSGGRDDMEDLQFLIRKEFKGEVSSYLHGLPIGATVELRGPKSEWDVKDLPEDLDSLVFAAGGTGITTALQVANAIFNEQRSSQESLPQMHIYWANRRREDCETGDPVSLQKGWFNWFWNPPSSDAKVDIKQSPIIQALTSLQNTYTDRVNVTYKVDEENTMIDHIELRGHSTQKDLPPQKISSIDNQIKEPTSLLMVCGPPGFVKAFTRPRKDTKTEKASQNPTFKIEVLP